MKKRIAIGIAALLVLGVILLPTGCKPVAAAPSTSPTMSSTDSPALPPTASDPRAAAESAAPADYKPVIYLYPERPTDVTVKLNINGSLTASYPAYGDGWRVTAYPGGDLIDRADGAPYKYLLWEGTADFTPDFTSGFVVKGDDTADFLREKLAEIGLTPTEYNDFIVFWLPKMQDNPYNLISFQFDNYDAAAALDITPAPDSILRVFMAFKPLQARLDVPPQTFAPFVREGFTVVEWGGCECD